jgi:hypothetical protein
MGCSAVFDSGETRLVGIRTSLRGNVPEGFSAGKGQYARVCLAKLTKFMVSASSNAWEALRPFAAMTRGDEAMAAKRLVELQGLRLLSVDDS